MNRFSSTGLKTFLKLSFLRYLMLIGKRVRIMKLGIEGYVIDETKNSLLLSTPNGNKRIIKQTANLIVYTEKGELMLRGKDINMRPWEYAL